MSAKNGSIKLVAGNSNRVLAQEIAKALDLQLRLGFIYLPRLLVALERYERERALFPTLGDFCPNLAKALHRPSAPHIEKP